MNKLEEKFCDILIDYKFVEFGQKYAVDECIKITEQECIGFAEWINIESYICSTNELWYQMSDGITDDGITTQTLFQLYLKSKENE